MDNHNHLSSEISCSICLDLILDNGVRSRAKLKCGHEFHLDCIGSAFNMKGEMQCPNCREVEDGQWLYVNAPTPSPPELNLQDWISDEDIYDTGYNELPFRFHWCPFGGARQVHSSFESSGVGVLAESVAGAHARDQVFHNHHRRNHHHQRMHHHQQHQQHGLPSHSQAVPSFRRFDGHRRLPATIAAPPLHDHNTRFLVGPPSSSSDEPEHPLPTHFHGCTQQRQPHPFSERDPSWGPSLHTNATQDSGNHST